MNLLYKLLCRPRHLPVLIFLLLAGITQVSGQLNYTFSTAAGIPAPPVGLTTQVVMPVASQDNFGYNFAPAGMNIRFGGQNYTRIFVSTNGWFALLNAAGTPASLATFLPNNRLSNNASGFPIIAPYWDDLSTTAIGYSYAANVLTVQWTCRIDKTNAAADNHMWARIDGTTGVITFSYKNNPAYVFTGTQTASIGIAGVCTGEYYSFLSATTSIDSTQEDSTIAAKPISIQYIFTPYQISDNCANATDLGPLTGTCTPQLFRINNATTSGSPMSCTAEVNDMWLKVTKPAGIVNVTVTTSSAAPACNSAPGTTLEAYSVCGGPAIACATTGSVANFGELVMTRPSCPETLYLRVTTDGDVGGKFNICASGTAGVSTGIACTTAVAICAPLPFNSLGQTTLGSQDNYDDSMLCQSTWMDGQDYVFSYTPPITQCINLSIDGTGANSFPGLFILDGCPNDTDNATCVASSMNPSNGDTISDVVLTGGHTYYIIVDNNAGLAGFNSIPFNIHMSTSGTAAPANDNCSGAISLGTVASNATCTWTLPTFTTLCATPSPTAGYPAPTCGGFTPALTNDVWLTFTAGYTGVLQIDGRGSGPNPSTHGGFAVYTGSCGSLTLVPNGCGGDSVSIPFQPQTTISVTNLTTYYVRYFTATGFEPGGFQLCFQANCSPPNDLPVNAAILTLGVPLMGDNTCSTGLQEMPNPVNCTTAPINTVWYRLIAPPSGQVAIRISQLSLLDAAVAAFLFPTGVANCATSFTPLACNDDIIFAPPCPICGMTGDNDAAIQFSTVPGNTVWVAVDGEFSATGSFWITAIEGTLASTFPPLFRKDCGNPETICSNVDYFIPNGGIGSDGNICDFMNIGCPNGGVTTSEVGSTWMQFTVQAGSRLGFTITPNDSASPIANFNFYLWDITGIPNICPVLASTPLAACNTATNTGKTGMRNPPTAVYTNTIGPLATARTFMLFVQNLTSANDDEGVPGTNTGFVLNWDVYNASINIGKTQLAGTSNVCNWGGTVVDNQYLNAANWTGVGTCPAPVPSCATDVNISAASQVCTGAGNIYAKNILINAGGTLSLPPGCNLHVCGDFTNNGTFNAALGSTVTFEGVVVQTINGNVTGANSFASLVVTKTNSTLVTLNANVDIKEHFTTTNATSVFNINHKYMKVGGNFTNFSGPITFLSLPVNSGSSTVEFNGAGNQNFTNTLGAISLNRVVMNKTGGKLYLMTANSSMNIDSSLTLTGGIIVTRAFPNLEVYLKHYHPVNSLLGPITSASWIDGKFRRKISNGPFASPPLPASYDFPLGDSLTPGGYNLANITFQTATTITDLQGTFTAWPSLPPPPGPVASECFIATYSNLEIFNNGYWTFKRFTAPFNFNGRHSMTLYNTGFTNNLGLGWTIAKCDTILPVTVQANWGLIGTCVPTSTPAQTMRINMNTTGAGVDSLAFNKHYATVQSEVPLPIELLFFQAEPRGEAVLCTWETATEINNEYFEVERSTDGKVFELVGRVAGFGPGTSSENRDYSLVDNTTCKDIIYYRLKQVDIDGKFSYSDLVAVNCKDKDVLSVHPNPARSIVTVSFVEPAVGPVQINFLDYTGRTILTKEVKAIKGFNQAQISIEELSEGVYYLDVHSMNGQNTSESRRVRFIKN